MPKKGTYKPGETVKQSGQVEIVSGGRRTGVERTIVKGEPRAPTPRKGDRYVEVDRTKHKRSRPRESCTTLVVRAFC